MKDNIVLRKKTLVPNRIQRGKGGSTASETFKLKHKNTHYVAKNLRNIPNKNKCYNQCRT